MYTVCPKCALTLVVTAADLRVAQGFVRCGRCSNVFNALARLSEDRSASSVGVASPTLSQPIPPQPPPEPEPPPATEPQSSEPPQSLADGDSIPDTALEFDPDATDVSKVFIERAPDPQWTAATGKFKALLKKMQPAQSPSQAGAPWPDSAPAAQPTTPQTGVSQTGASQTGVSQTSPAQTVAARASAPQGRAVSSQPTQSAQRATAPTPAASSLSSVPASQATPPAATPKTIPTDEDAQFDIEVDAE